jgi:hypothetical protein
VFVSNSGSDRSQEIVIMTEAEQESTRLRRTPGDLRDYVGGEFGADGRKAVQQRVSWHDSQSTCARDLFDNESISRCYLQTIERLFFIDE